MADFTFNVALGKVAYYAGLPAANDALIVIPIETTGVESDATLKDYDDVATILAASNNEQTTMGRKTITSATVTVDDTNNCTDVDTADLVWAGATGNPISDLLVAYDPDTTTGTDSSLIPMWAQAVTINPDGNNVQVVMNAAGVYRSN